MLNPVFIAGDWGNSHLRLYLCEMQSDGRANLLDNRTGPGVQQVDNDFDSVFFSTSGDWLEQYGNIQVILSGAIGSNIGWRHTPYLSCPVGATEIAAGGVRFVVRGINFYLLSGVKAQNPIGSADVMRGEELQLLGWLELNSAYMTGNRLLVLPGTHNKWLWVTDGQLLTFLTAYTGELFKLLSERSILVSDAGPLEIDNSVFCSGVQAIQNHSEAQLVHTLFSTRSKQVLGEMPAGDATAYLSGLVIGADVAGAIKIFRRRSVTLPPVVIIGEPRLANLYRLTLQQMNVDTTCLDVTTIALSGYASVRRSLSTHNS